MIWDKVFFESARRDLQNGEKKSKLKKNFLC